MAQRKIPIFRPMLVTHEKIVPYLKEIDENRWYSNFGPLVTRFEKSLAGHFDVDEDCISTVSSATAGLINCLRALNLEPGTFCVMPSWTFVATPASACAAGLVPYFVDVDPATWALDPEHIKKIIPTIPGKVSSVMPVIPFGIPMDTAKWDSFSEETGIPVIIDGAAAFDAISSVKQCAPARTPIVISMHATKSFGIGEGGAVISTNAHITHRVREMSNFGFATPREILVPGTNGKMSEYAAAIGLATLEAWPEIRAKWLTIKRYYIEALAGVVSSGITSPWLSDKWISSTCNLRLPIPAVPKIVRRLAEEGIEARQWWVRGCHNQIAYSKHPRGALKNTDELGNSVISLPFSLDLPQSDVEHVVERLAYCVNSELVNKIALQQDALLLPSGGNELAEPWQGIQTQ